MQSEWDQARTRARQLPQDLDALLTEQETCGLLGLSVRTLQNWRLRGGGPAYLKCGRAVRYRRRDLLSWMDEHTRRHTGDSGPDTSDGAGQ